MIASAVVFDFCLQILKIHTKVRTIFHLTIYHCPFFTFHSSLFTFFTYFATLILQMCAKHLLVLNIYTIFANDLSNLFLHSTLSILNHEKTSNYCSCFLNSDGNYGAGRED